LFDCTDVHDYARDLASSHQYYRRSPVVRADIAIVMGGGAGLWANLPPTGTGNAKHSPSAAPFEEDDASGKAASRIFLSYRRNDDAGSAGRVHDRLLTAFDKSRLFMDVDGIPPGADYIDYLSREVEACDVLLAVIGKNWRGVQRVDGGYPIDDEKDFVRIEIAAALERRKKVIPVLIGDVPFLSDTDLPPSISTLARRQSVRIRHDTFGSDMERLINSLKQRN
jgi:hypothetical protein